MYYSWRCTVKYQLLDKLQFRDLPEVPYSPNRISSDFHLFTELELILAGTSSLDNEVDIQNILVFLCDKKAKKSLWINRYLDCHDSRKID